MQREEPALTGRNWGKPDIVGGTLVFTVAGKPAFRVPLKDVGQVSCASMTWLESPNSNVSSST